MESWMQSEDTLLWPTANGDDTMADVDHEISPPPWWDCQEGAFDRVASQGENEKVVVNVECDPVQDVLMHERSTTETLDHIGVNDLFNQGEYQENFKASHVDGMEQVQLSSRQLKAQPISTKKQDIEGEPTDKDILCGRGSGNYLSPGNVWLDAIIKKNQQAYTSVRGKNKTERDIKKNKIVVSCLEEVRKAKGRFVDYERNNNDNNKEEEDHKQWYEIIDKKAYEKVRALLSTDKNVKAIKRAEAREAKEGRPKKKVKAIKRAEAREAKEGRPKGLLRAGGLKPSPLPVSNTVSNAGGLGCNNVSTEQPNRWTLFEPMSHVDPATKSSRHHNHLNHPSDGVSLNQLDAVFDAEWRAFKGFPTVGNYMAIDQEQVCHSVNCMHRSWMNDVLPEHPETAAMKDDGAAQDGHDHFPLVTEE